MIQVVLQAHPNSAKAHYVDAEILAKEGRLAQARKKFQDDLNIINYNYPVYLFYYTFIQKQA